MVYIVNAIHCPSTGGVNPNCYSITGAYTTASTAQAAMLAKVKELYIARRDRTGRLLRGHFGSSNSLIQI
jgi:hypothetical protein